MTMVAASTSQADILARNAGQPPRSAGNQGASAGARGRVGNCVEEALQLVRALKPDILLRD
jgi:hypothetical protein